jgi:hypothetical protein
MPKTLLALAFLALVIGLLFALNTILPNRRFLWPTKNREQTPLPVSFAWIACQESRAYVEYALSMKAPDLNASLARVIHGKSFWARRKFQQLYFATVATTVGVVTGVLGVLVEMIARA